MCVCLGDLRHRWRSTAKKRHPNVRHNQTDSQREHWEILSTCCNCQVSRPTSSTEGKTKTNGVCAMCMGHGATAQRRHSDNRKRKWRPGEMLVITKMKNWSYRGVVNVMSPWFRHRLAAVTCRLSLDLAGSPAARCDPHSCPEVVCLPRKEGAR